MASTKDLLFFTIGILALVTIIRHSNALDCNNVVVLESEGVLNWLGNVTFTVPRTATNWTVLMTFDYPFTGVGTWGFWTSQVEENIAKFWSRYDETETLNQGQLLTFRFRVNYFTDVPRPAVVSLTFENVELCNTLVEKK